MSGLRVVLTCSACPEQYDVFLDDEAVGYLRLRHGYFAAYRCTGPGLEDIKWDSPVYTADTIGDGMFDDSERAEHMGNALAALGITLADALAYAEQVGS